MRILFIAGCPDSGRSQTGQDKLHEYGGVYTDRKGGGRTSCRNGGKTLNVSPGWRIVYGAVKTRTGLGPQAFVF